jgi:hypothetical protein
MYRPFLFACVIMLLHLSGYSQKNYRAGTIPQSNINFPVAKKFKLNTKLESRQIFFEQEPGHDKSNNIRYERTDLSVILTRKISADNTIGGGYLVRLEDGKFSHRLIQQFNHVKSYETIRLAHRIVLDETFSSEDPTEIRLRYRLGLERALSGRKIDVREYYLKVNNEYLGIFSSGDPDLEIRASAAVGYNATDDNKVEVGFEYRVNEFNSAVKAQQFWLTIGWFLSV